MSQREVLMLLEEFDRPVRPAELERRYAEKNRLMRPDPGHHGMILRALKELTAQQFVVKTDDGRYFAVSVAVSVYMKGILLTA